MGMSVNDPWSMDAYFLFNLNALIQDYVESRFNNDYERMYYALDSIETLSSPKLENDEVEQNLEKIRQLIEVTYPFLSDGKRGYRPQFIPQIRYLLNKTFRMVLVKLEQKNIYTKKTVDLNTVMGQLR